MTAAAFKVTPDLAGADIASGVMAGALAHPEKPALLFEDRCLTFAQLAERIQRVAALARHEMQLRPGDCAAVYAPNCLAYIELVAGLSRAGIMVATPTHRALAGNCGGFWTIAGLGITIAVGTLIAGRPPHRSRRALLTHRAPASGV